MERYSLQPESPAGPCEWETFLEGAECAHDATLVILDTHDHSHNPEGFHWAHLCDDHAEHGLAIANKAS